MRSWIVFTAVALVALIPAGSAEAAASKAKRCTPKGSKTVVKNRYGRVFTERGAGPGSVADPGIRRRLLGCLYSTGRRVTLSVDYRDGSAASGKFSAVRLNGRFAAWQYDAYDNSCRADCPPYYQPLQQTINIADLRTRRDDSFAGAAQPDTLAVTRGGTARWLDATTGEPRRASLR